MRFAHRSKKRNENNDRQRSQKKFFKSNRNDTNTTHRAGSVSDRQNPCLKQISKSEPEIAVVRFFSKLDRCVGRCDRLRTTPNALEIESDQSIRSDCEDFLVRCVPGGTNFFGPMLRNGKPEFSVGILIFGWIYPNRTRTNWNPPANHRHRRYQKSPHKPARQESGLNIS